jgi:hypothetical protein
MHLDAWKDLALEIDGHHLESPAGGEVRLLMAPVVMWVSSELGGFSAFGRVFPTE